MGGRVAEGSKFKTIQYEYDGRFDFDRDGKLNIFEMLLAQPDAAPTWWLREILRVVHETIIRLHEI